METYIVETYIVSWNRFKSWCWYVFLHLILKGNNFEDTRPLININESFVKSFYFISL